MIYLSHKHPNIALDMSMVSQFMHSQFMHSLGQEHFDVVYRILRYLKGTLGKGLLFEDRGHLRFEVLWAYWARSFSSSSVYFSS